MATTNTFYFEDIFTSYEDFKEFTDSLGIYEATDVVSEAFNQYLFNILYARYCGNSINYNVPQYFLYAFGLRYIDSFKKFKKQKELIDKINELTEEDLQVLTETISNGAFNPNDTPTEYWKPLNYITNQSATRLNSPKLIAFINAVQAMPTQRIEEFTETFIDLFTLFMPTGKYIY